MREIILANVDLQRFRWDVHIHSSEELGDEFVHIYVLQKVKRPCTRLELARRRENADRLAIAHEAIGADDKVHSHAIAKRRPKHYFAAARARCRRWFRG